MTTRKPPRWQGVTIQHVTHLPNKPKPSKERRRARRARERLGLPVPDALKVERSVTWSDLFRPEIKLKKE